MKLPMKSLMKCLCSGFACLFLFLLAASPPVSSVSSPTPSTPAKAKPTNAAKLIDQAAAAFTAGELENAIGFYEQAKELLPDLPQIPYNQAIAHYRKGDFQRASELFNDAILLSENPELQNKARYNLGNAIYEQSRPYLTGQNAPPDPQKNAEQLEKATKGLEKALDHYKQAVNADPQDLDARHNAELSHQLLKQLRELQEQEQQQQQDSQDQQDEQDEQDQQQGQDQVQDVAEGPQKCRHDHQHAAHRATGGGGLPFQGSVADGIGRGASHARHARGCPVVRTIA